MNNTKALTDVDISTSFDNIFANNSGTVRQINKATLFEALESADGYQALKSEVNTLQGSVNGIDTTTDTTLSVSGKAADAKIAGDKLAALKEKDDAVDAEIGSLKESLGGRFKQKYLLGNIENSTGQITSAKRVVTDGYIQYPVFCKQIIIKINNKSHKAGYGYRIYAYYSDGSYKGMTTDWMFSRDAPEYTLEIKDDEVYKIKFDDKSLSGNNMPSIDDVENDVTFEFVREKTVENNEINGRLPDFLQDEYTETTKSIFEKSTADSFSFGFATDLHFSAKGSGYAESDLRDRIERNFIVMSKISKEIPLDIFVLGGDYQQQPQPNKGQTKQQGIDTIYDVNRWFSKIDCLRVALPGNHELNYSGTGTGYGLTDDEIFYLLEKKYISNNIKKANKFVFYSISEENQIVYVYLARGEIDYSIDVENGLKVIIEKNVKKYPLIIFNHYSITNNGEISFQIVTKSIDYLLENNAEIIAWVGGHNHSDWDNTYKNVLVISCLQSGAWTSEPSKNGITYEHVNKTSTESAFSIFTVDKTNKKIYCTRFGLGDDREWNYQ